MCDVQTLHFTRPCETPGVVALHNSWDVDKAMFRSPRGRIAFAVQHARAPSEHPIPSNLPQEIPMHTKHCTWPPNPALFRQTANRERSQVWLRNVMACGSRRARLAVHLVKSFPENRVSQATRGYFWEALEPLTASATLQRHTRRSCARRMQMLCRERRDGGRQVTAQRIIFFDEATTPGTWIRQRPVVEEMLFPGRMRMR